MFRKLFLIPFVFVLAAATSYAEDKIRIFVTDSQSWETKGSGGAVDGTGGGRFSGGARPQNAEIAKTIKQRCPLLTVTMKEDRADYILTLDHEGGKKLLQKDNKWAVYDAEGDMVDAGSTRSLGNSVKDACKAIIRDRGLDQ